MKVLGFAAVVFWHPDSRRPQSRAAHHQKYVRGLVMGRTGKNDSLDSDISPVLSIFTGGGVKES